MNLDLDLDDAERVWLYRLAPYLVRVEEGLPKRLLDTELLAARFRESPEQEWLLTLGPVETVSARAGVLPFLLLAGDPVLFQLRGTGVVAAGHVLGASQIPPPNLRWLLRFEIDAGATRDFVSRPIPDDVVDPLLPERTWNDLVDLGRHREALGAALRRCATPRPRPRARRAKG